MSSSLVVPGFGGGVVKVSSAEAMQTNELEEADGADIGDREQLIMAALASGYSDTRDNAGNPLSPVFGIWFGEWSQDIQCLLAGKGKDGAAVDRYFIYRFDPSAEPAVVPIGKSTVMGTIAYAVTAGAVATFASFPYVLGGVQVRPIIVCIASRTPDSPRLGCELLVLIYDGVSAYTTHTLDFYDTLGTGPGGEFPTGTKSKKLHPRGVAAYNNHIFLWGFDNSDATNGDAPARLMFSNLGNPLKYGNDDIGTAGTDRDFDDTDAINIGEGGEEIRACLASGGKLWIGTNRGLHYLQGFGRDSFKTDGTTGIARSLDVVGPNALREGPDGNLYGCSTQGLWMYDGAVNAIGAKLIDVNGHSNGFWDLIWSDKDGFVGKGNGWPGRTNADLVWMMTDVERHQVWVVIPFCDSASGAGYGFDTVIVKYNALTGGFTRQVFVGVAYVAGMRIPRTGLTPETIILANAAPLGGTLQRYRFRATPTSKPAAAPMSLTFGEYAPYGPNGVGVNRVVYLTIAWEDASSLPIVSGLVLTVDGQQVDAMTLTVGGAVAPVAPADGDIWLDVTGTDFSIGNLSSGAFIPATNDYLLFRWVQTWGKWVRIPRSQGMKGTRATIPIAYKATPGTRVKVRATVSAAGRITVESLGLGPQAVRTAE